MLFRTLQHWYDLFSYGDGRAAEEQAIRERQWQEWRERRLAKLEGRKPETSEEFEIQRPTKHFYETIAGEKAAEAVEQQRHLEGRSRRYPRNLTEAHQQAEDAEHEAWEEDLKTAFGEFDKENKDNRIERLREELRFLEEKEPEPVKSEVKDRNWEEINKTPARGWTKSSSGEPYRQMEVVKAPIVPVEIPIEDEDESPATEINWKAVNQAAKETKNSEQARANQKLAESVHKSELADFWQELAREYELKKSSEWQEEIEEWGEENAA